jgi:transcriptional regulator GlxA family with amidase domain
MTPAAYLRTHRLNAAHRELLSADPAVSTVTEIALRWGFGHPGRFSQIHRKLFDEKPSATLSKTRF